MTKEYQKHPLAGLFGSWSSQGVRFCLFKSMDRWEETLVGATDADVLIDEDQESKAQKLLTEQGWISLQAEPWRRFLAVSDHVRFHPEVGRFLHLHLHTRLVAGEKLLKSFSLPWASLYLEHTRQEPWPPHVEPELEMIVFLLRVCVKLNWADYARIILHQSPAAVFRDHMSEYQDLALRCDREKFIRLLDSPHFKAHNKAILLDAFDSLSTLSLYRRIKLVKSFKKHRRMGLTRRLGQRFMRSWLKRWLGVGKTLPGQGLSIAFCGPDGSGKTTQAKLTKARLQEHFRVTKLYMGGNWNSAGLKRWAITRTLWPLYLITRKACKIIGLNHAAEQLRKAFFNFDDLLMVSEKLNRNQQALAARRQGHIVIFERFPLFPEYGDAGAVNTPYRRAAYKTIALPDILFLFETDLETALKRRADTPLHILQGKVEAFKQYAATQRERNDVIFLDPEAPLEVSLAIALQAVQEHLASHARNA